MDTSNLLATLLILVLVVDLRVDSCLRLDRWINAGKCSEFNDIKEKFLGGSLTSIKDESCLFEGPESPTLEDLSAMFNDLSNGVVPKYIQENNYEAFGKASTNYSYSYGNTGTADGMMYGVFQKDGEITSHSSLDFRFIRGSVFEFNYTAGQALFSHVRYSVKDNVLSFQESTLGGLMYKTPSYGYVLYGNYTGLSDCEAIITGETMSSRSDTLGILNIPNQYYSRDVMYQTGKYNLTHSSQRYNIYSLTGGTNSTVEMISGAQTESDYLITMKGTIVSPEKESTLEGKTKYTAQVDKSHPFSDQNLPGIFSSPRALIGIYLP